MSMCHCIYESRCPSLPALSEVAKSMAEMTEQFRYHVSNMPWFGSAAYLFCVWSLHKIMSAAERKPVNIPKAVLVLYNVAQVVLNLYVALMISGPIKGKVWGIGIPDTPAVRYGVYLHMLCKVKPLPTAHCTERLCVDRT